jgi:acetyl esterase/lipase
MPDNYKPEQAPVFLYPGGAPNSKPTPKHYNESFAADRYARVSEPLLIPFIPERGNGTAVIICPGGSYSVVVIEHEGYAVARKFNELGIAAFILKYRLPSDDIMFDKTTGPLQDAQTAIKVVRERAEEWGVNAEKVGVIGFSAGGHLAASLSTTERALICNSQNISLIPNFMILGYPVITAGKWAHQPSVNNLLGQQPPAESLILFSKELQVTGNTPPAFIVHAQDDEPVPVQNSILFYNALTEAGVKAEMHLYPGGGHGFGLSNPTTKDNWFDRLINWMFAGGFI